MVKECTNTCSIRGRYVPKTLIALYLVVASQIRSLGTYVDEMTVNGYVSPTDGIPTVSDVDQ